MTHGAGAFMLPVLSRGGPVVLTANASPGHLLELVECQRITSTWVPPTLLYKLIDEQKARPRDTTSLAHLVWGGAVASVTRLLEAQSVFGPVIETAYGQTEAPLALSTLRAGDLSVEARLASVGRVSPLVELAILDPEGRQCSRARQGKSVPAVTFL